MSLIASLSFLPLLAQDEPKTKSLLQYIHGGGTIGYVIILLSIAAVALVFLHFIQVRRERLAPPVIVQGLRQLLADNQIEEASRYCAREEHDSFLARVFGSALLRCSKSAFGFLEMRSALEDSGREQLDRLQRTTDSVALIAGIAPMLGLLGTVVGMVGAFDTISSSQGVARPSELAGYISIALITTVQGLVVAIPCTAAYSFMRNRIDKYAAEVGVVCEDLAATIELSSGVRRPAAEPARPAPRPAAPRPEPAREAQPR